MFHSQAIYICISNTYLVLIITGLNIRITFEENPNISLPLLGKDTKNMGINNTKKSSFSAAFLFSGTKKGGTPASLNSLKT